MNKFRWRIELKRCRDYPQLLMVEATDILEQFNGFNTVFDIGSGRLTNKMRVCITTAYQVILQNLINEGVPLCQSQEIMVDHS